MLSVTNGGGWFHYKACGRPFFRIEERYVQV